MVRRRTQYIAKDYGHPLHVHERSIEQAMRQRLVARINHAREALRRQQALESAELSVAQPAPETAEIPA